MRAEKIRLQIHGKLARAMQRHAIASNLVRLALVATVMTVAALSLSAEVSAHRSGCHRWHSCPSDTGSYVCGDLGHCSACPDNQYCEAQQPKRTTGEQRPQSTQPGASTRPGVPPASPTMCPTAAPIKGNFTTYSGERCIYHMPGGQYYGRTKPERCYATETEAKQDGCRASKR